MDNDKQKKVSNRRSNYKYSNKNYQQTNHQRRNSYYQNTNKRRSSSQHSSNLESDEMKFSDELDTSFVEKRRVNKDKIIRDLDNSYQKENKPKKGSIKIILHLLLIILLLSITVLCTSLYFTYISPKVVEKAVTKEVVVMDDNYLFLGDSITDFYDLDEYYEGLPVVNSGIDGNDTQDILDDMENRVYQYNPSKVFLLIGTNDIDHGDSLDSIVDNIEKILLEIRENRPYAELYLESIYPVMEGEKAVNSRTNEKIMTINDKLEEFCEKEQITYIDMFDLLVDSSSEKVQINPKYTKDGLHLSDEGYDVVTNEVKKYLK